MEPDAPSYVLVQRCEDSSVRLISEKTENGARTVFVFNERVAAQAFLIHALEDLGTDWEVLELTSSATAVLLEACADEGASYVVLNPPTALTRGDGEEPPLIPILGFVDYLRGSTCW
jgi:hypothetical protein